MSRTLGRSHQTDEKNVEQPFYLPQEKSLFRRADANIHCAQEDLPKCKYLIESLISEEKKSKEQLQYIQGCIDVEDFDKGMGFYAAKNMVFLEYLSLLKVYQLYRINARDLSSGSGLELYKRLAYLKTLLIKIAPVEKKLEYQKNKILRNAEKALVRAEPRKENASDVGEQEDEIQSNSIEQEIEDNIEVQEEDEMSFKPRPSVLMNLKKQRETKMKQNVKYEAPKISAALSKEDKLRDSMMRKKQRHKISLMRRFQSDLVDTDNAEEKYLGDEVNAKLKKRFEEKTRYEEENFTRLPESKKDKFYRKQMMRNSMKKNQLEDDFKEVQMVRQLFDKEQDMERKIKAQKRRLVEREESRKQAKAFKSGKRPTDGKHKKIHKRN